MIAYRPIIIIENLFILSLCVYTCARKIHDESGCACRMLMDSLTRLYRCMFIIMRRLDNLIYMIVRITDEKDPARIEEQILAYVRCNYCCTYTSIYIYIYIDNWMLRNCVMRGCVRSALHQHLCACCLRNINNNRYTPNDDAAILID